MSALTPSRDTLAKALAEAERSAPFDYDAVGWKRRHDYQADALLASGAVIDAATLADDEELLRRVSFHRHGVDLPPSREASKWVRALAAALSEQDASR